MIHEIHTHPDMERKLKVPDDHCIIDRKVLNDYCQKDAIVDIFRKMPEKFKSKKFCEWMNLAVGDFLLHYELKKIKR